MIALWRNSFFSLACFSRRGSLCEPKPRSAGFEPRVVDDQSSFIFRRRDSVISPISMPPCGLGVSAYDITYLSLRAQRSNLPCGKEAPSIAGDCFSRKASFAMTKILVKAMLSPISMPPGGLGVSRNNKRVVVQSSQGIILHRSNTTVEGIVRANPSQKYPPEHCGDTNEEKQKRGGQFTCPPLFVPLHRLEYLTASPPH
jgi:hypothetical protein